MLNAGIIRLVAFSVSRTAIPLIPFIAFLIINLKCAKRVEKCEAMGKYIIFSSITFTLAQALYPDSVEFGGTLFFFGIFENDIGVFGNIPITKILVHAAAMLWVANIVILIIQCVMLRRCNKQQD